MSTRKKFEEESHKAQFAIHPYVIENRMRVGIPKGHFASESVSDNDLNALMMIWFLKTLY